MFQKKWKASMTEGQRPALKIALLADVHLEAKFSMLPLHARKVRRFNIRRALETAVETAVSRGVDAIMIAGDLYEEERFSPDTAEFCRRIFGDASPVPVLLAPGNHDWYGPNSMYAALRWTPNVHVFRTNSLEPYDLEDGVRVWGFAHLSPATEIRPLDNFSVEGRADIHLGLIHGAETSRLRAELALDPNKRSYAPFDEKQIEKSGLHHVFAGHFHSPSRSRWCTYPGNPDPLSFHEGGGQLKRGLVILEVSERGEVREVERVEVAQSRVCAVEVDVTEVPDSSALLDEIERRLGESALQGWVEGAFLLVRLVGRLSATIDLSDVEANLGRRMTSVAALVVDTSGLRPGLSLDSIRAERSIRGEFVRLVEASGLEADIEAQVLHVGLEALGA
jgi:exonuclease SbcD